MKTIKTLLLLLFLVINLLSCNNIKQDEKIDSESINSTILPSNGKTVLTYKTKTLDNKKLLIIKKNMQTIS